MYCMMCLCQFECDFWLMCFRNVLNLVLKQKVKGSISCLDSILGVKYSEILLSVAAFPYCMKL